MGSEKKVKFIDRFSFRKFFSDIIFDEICLKNRHFELVQNFEMESQSHLKSYRGTENAKHIPFFMSHIVFLVFAKKKIMTSCRAALIDMVCVLI